MNKSELIRQIASGAEVSYLKAAKMLDVMRDAVTSALFGGQKVAIRDFGTFEVRNHAARRYRNPQTKKIGNAPARRVVKFVPSSEIQTRLN